MTEPEQAIASPAAGNAALGGADSGGISPLIEDARAIAADARGLVAAELDFAKAWAGTALAGGKAIAGLVALALVLLVFALFALVTGLLLTLAPLIGGLGATAVVTLGLVATAGLALAGALARFRWTKKQLSGTGATTDDRA